MKHLKPFIVLSAVVVTGLVAMYTASIWPKYGGDKISTTETQVISRTQGIGGVASGSSAGPAENEQQERGSSNTVATQTEAVAFEDVAPRQAEIKRSTQVEYEYRALRTSNDPLPQSTWVTSATRSQSAWDTATGNGVVVAVIDSGFALNHEDLASQWYQNSGETGTTTLGGRCWTGTSANKATNNCDDDNNGYRDDWRGWDFVGVNNLPQAGETNPSGQGVSHGTQVAGLVGAAGNNAVGSSTVSWNNKIMPLQALSDEGSGYTSSIASAVYYAVDNGAKVINMSLGGDTNDPTLANAIKYAYDRGVVTVAAAGNCGTGNESGCNPAKPGAMGYPALNPYVIAVGATTSTGARASFSSYGPGLDVSAPGSGTMISPMWQAANQTSAYSTSLYGTSFASPIVASYIGLLKSIRPSSTVEDITALVDATAWKPSGMSTNIYSTEFGHGVIDASAGLRVAGSLNSNQNQPELLQIGNEKSERNITDSSLINSGCKAGAGSYCTLKAVNSLGYARYLPYTEVASGSQAQWWSWDGTWLGGGLWSLTAQIGDRSSSTSYGFFNK